jgi:hypothetical protein
MASPFFEASEDGMVKLKGASVGPNPPEYTTVVVRLGVIGSI